MLRDKVELLTTAQVARRLKQSEEVVRRKARDGTLPALRLGPGPRAPLRFDERALEAWLYGIPAASPESPASAADPSPGQSSGLRSAGNEAA
jgi:excisionase family DNA binding protein